MKIRIEKFNGLVAACALVLVGGGAQASTLYVQTTPAGAQSYFAPASVLDFDSAAPGTYASFTEGVLTFSSDTGVLFVDGDYIGQYNNFGVNSVHSCYCDGSFGELYFDFSTPLEGFGFFWGASDAQWTLTAYDGSNNVLETFALPTTGPSNAGDFVAIYGSGIARAVLAGPSSDYVFVDNVTFGARYVGPGAGGIPEPSTWAMLIAGFAGAGCALRRRPVRRTAAI